MNNITWERILWTNDGVFLSATKVRKAVRDCVRTKAGEALRFDLFVFKNNNGSLIGSVIENLHWEFRGMHDTKYFNGVLAHEHEENPKAVFRIVGYRANVEKEDC